AYVVPLPGARLQDVVVRVGAEARAEAAHELLERRARRARAAPQLAPPPLLRVEPRRPHHAERGESLRWRRGVVAAMKRRVGRERRDLSLEPHDAVTVCPGG